ncbi:MAG: DUF2231 domain-containing protein [Ignavibacteriales bacterium]|nr:DUF2231 domain-containing protein [Ignavibacteriales bacterium]
MEFLSGLHSKVIHFPIAFFILYFLFETSGIILKKDFLAKSAFIVLALGVIFSVLSVLTGNQAFEVVKTSLQKNELTSLIERHEQLATVTLWYFFLMLISRTYLTVKKKFEGNIRYAFILFGLIGCVLIYITGIYGGELVYKYGVGTGLFGK